MEPHNDLDISDITWEYANGNSFAYAVKGASYSQPSRRYGKTEALGVDYSMRGRPSMFSIGQFVKLKSGTASQRVLQMRWNPTLKCAEIKCEYLNSRKELAYRPETDFETVINPINETKPETTKEDPMKGKLFQTLAGTVYGEGLVIDGDGKYVLKLNNGEYKAYASTELKRVMPFTFDVVFNGMSNKRYSYLGKVGSVEVGDVLMDSKDFTIARVVAIGTESDAATKTFEGVKLKTEALV